jgi:hypothetical protein
MRSPENEPESEKTRNVLDEEERKLLDRPDVPDDVKAEITERLERWHDEELDEET